MSRDKEGTVAVVTSAAAGIGRGIAIRLAEEGASVAALDVADATDTAERATDAGGRAIAIECDVSDPRSVDSAASRVRRQLETPTIVVNAAGIYPVSTFAELDFEAWRHVTAVNLDGTFLVCRAFADAMTEVRKGRIVNIASSVVATNTPAQVPYIASKMGVIGLTRALANDLGPRGDITVNAVAPGVVHTERLDRAAAELKTDGFDLFADVQMRQAIKRGGAVEDIVSLVSYLTSDSASFITAQTLAVDGGVMRAG